MFGQVTQAHACGSIGIGRFNEQVIVVAHQAVGVHRPIEAFADLRQHDQPSILVSIVVVNILAPVTARGGVIKRVCEFKA